MKILASLLLIAAASQSVLSFQPSSLLTQAKTGTIETSSVLHKSFVSGLFDDQEDDDTKSNWFEEFF